MDFLKGRKGRKKDKDGDRSESISSPSIDSLGSPLDEPPRGDNIPPRAGRHGGWDETPPGSGSAKNKNPINVIEQERFSRTNDPASPTHDNIPTIPDLDDLAEEQFNEMIPQNSMSLQMAATYKVLDKDTKPSSYSSLDGVDLSLLSKGLETGDIDEPDEEWNWDSLFAQIISEITSGNATSAVGHTSTLSPCVD